MPSTVTSQLKKLLIISLGCLLLASSIVFFFSPNQIVTGGPPGIGIILYYLFEVPVGLTVFLINFSLVVLGGKRYGRAYFFRTVYAVVLAAALIEILVYLFPDPALTDKPYWTVLLGSIMMGLGIALCFMGEASSGGMATAAQMIAQRIGIPVGRVIQMMDGTIVLLSAILFASIESALWAAVGVVITGFMIDAYMRWHRRKLVVGG